MNEALRQKLLDRLNSAGGSMAYADLIQDLDRMEYSLVPRVLRAMKQEGLVNRVVARDPVSGQMSYTVSIA